MKTLRAFKPLTYGVRFFSLGRATLGRSLLPPVCNESMLDYRPGSIERENLKKAIKKFKEKTFEVPCIIGGQEVRTGSIGKQLNPGNHTQIVCEYHKANEKISNQAIESSLNSKAQWEALPFEERAAIFLRAADLLSTKYRADMCAAMMIGSGKTVWQAEIDAAVEIIDFWRFNTYYAQELYNQQPPKHAPRTWNRIEYRPLEGFIFAVSPFNFAAIGANLASTPALLGNTVVWKPASTSVLANYITFQILKEAGLPPGVVNFLPGEGRLVSGPILNHSSLAGLHFTGSTQTFNNIWKTIATNLSNYYNYPRIVGETGGKNFHFLHASADVDNAVYNTIRAAFEYQGQKCSACSRVYVPDNLWPQFKQKLVQEVAKIKMGPVDDFSTFMSAVIDKASFDNIKSIIEQAREDKSNEIIIGGKCDDSVGYYVEPTVIVTKDPKSRTMIEEIFGPVLTIYVYPANEYSQTLQLCNETSNYGLTGALFANDRYAIEEGNITLRYAAGNFYVNDKSTGAVVGQQPFGGARQSGTNDKAGSAACLMRWVSPRTIKESFLPAATWAYPHMLPETEQNHKQ